MVAGLVSNWSSGPPQLQRSTVEGLKNTCGNDPHHPVVPQVHAVIATWAVRPSRTFRPTNRSSEVIKLGVWDDALARTRDEQSFRHFAGVDGRRLSSEFKSASVYVPMKYILTYHIYSTILPYT